MWNGNINDTVTYKDSDSNTLRNGRVMEVSSDMDSYEDMRLENGIPMYWSKKTKKYVPVKDKNMDTVYISVISGENTWNERTDYIFLNEIVSGANPPVKEL
tara:strand:+ start:393 stop:695 length:303 start_codon:yes stop_codon:yes gene_type:complete